MGGLRPCIIRGAELGGVEICGGVDSASGDDTVGGRGADVGDSETRGGVEALLRDVDAAAGDEAAES